MQLRAAINQAFNRRMQNPWLLLVEDDAAVARVNARRLRPFFEVQVATTIAEAYAAIEARLDDGSRPLTAALIDVELPDGSGLDLASTLLRGKSKPHVAILTAHDIDSVNGWAFAHHVPLLRKDHDPSYLEQWARGVANASSEERFERVFLRFARETGLSDKEIATLRVAVRHEGLTRREIARRRGVEEATIKTQVNGALRKTGCANMRELRERVQRLVDGPDS